MRWELFEVIAVDVDGYENIIDTTKSLKEARDLAKQALTEGAVEVIINREVDDVVEEVEVIKST